MKILKYSFFSNIIMVAAFGFDKPFFYDLTGLPTKYEKSGRIKIAQVSINTGWQLSTNKNDITSKDCVFFLYQNGRTFKDNSSYGKRWMCTIGIDHTIVKVENWVHFCPYLKWTVRT